MRHLVVIKSYPLAVIESKTLTVIKFDVVAVVSV